MGPHDELMALEPEKEFFVGVDSDGCVFDTMDIKQKKCFAPNTAKHWNLQIIDKYVREVTEFTNLYSRTRGVNRFIALIGMMDLLRKRKEVKDLNVDLPDLSALSEWIEQETQLGLPALEKYAEKTGDPIIKNTLAWALAINKDIAEVVKNIQPFSFCVESLEKLSKRADLIVVSQTPVEALVREWQEHDIDRYVKIIAGQEHGTKSEHLRFAAGNKYSKDKILMLGDAFGDMDAAKNNGVLFYPINPGHENESWSRFYNEAIDKFFNGSFKGEYEDGLVSEFKECLPETPPWEQ